jgi:hypothetical protein
MATLQIKAVNSKGCKLDLEDVIVVWIGQVNAKNETATDEVIKELA